MYYSVRYSSYQPKLVKLEVASGFEFATLNAVLLPLGLRSKLRIFPEDRLPKAEEPAEEFESTNGFTKPACC